MVVVSAPWIMKNVVYPGSTDVIAVPKMAARAVLMCRPNSHPFQERSLLLDQPVKIGRSVARARAAPNNAIFDCKVLSRNHALLWYEHGKFYLQDTKSSNGTFVNNQRLSKGAEESPPREVCSGDIVQFGVDVMENSRKVTHGCIVATLKLYLPDGKEAKASPSTSVSSVGVVPLEDLYQLNQYIQEALQREQLLEHKLATLQQLVETTRLASDLGWKALIDEDRLLSRVEILETQLQTYSKSFTEDKLREELRKLQEDKVQYQGSAKESLRKILEEKLEAMQKMSDLERTLTNTEGECAHLKELREKSQSDLQELAQKYTQQVQKFEDLSLRLQETEDQHREVCEKLEQEKLELESKLEEHKVTEQTLQTRLDEAIKSNDNQKENDSFQKECDILDNHLVCNKELAYDKDILPTKENETDGSENEIVLERINSTDLIEENLKEELESLRYQLKKSEEDCQEKSDLVDELLGQYIDLGVIHSTTITRIEELEENLICMQEELDKERDKPSTSQAQTSNQACKIKSEIKSLEELLSNTRIEKKTIEDQMAQCQSELDAAKCTLKKCSDETDVLRHQLQMAQKQLENKKERIGSSGSELQWFIMSTELKQQLSTLQEHYNDESQKAKKFAEEAQRLRREVMEAQQAAKQSHNEAEKLKDWFRALQIDPEMRRNSGVLEGDNKEREELNSLRLECELLQSENLRLKQECQKLDEMSSILLEKDLIIESLNCPDSQSDLLSQFEEIKSDHEATLVKLIALEEELVLFKEKYAQCNDERLKLIQNFQSLSKKSISSTDESITVPLRLLLPIVLVIIAVLLAIKFF